jgi:hypothetical protein
MSNTSVRDGDTLLTLQHKIKSRLLKRLMAAGAVVLAALGASASGAVAQTGGIIQRGDAVVTAFAGTVPPANPPADVHPLDRTFIDLQGLTAQIFDLSNLGGGPAGQLADAPVKFRAKAGEIGHVFGIAFEGDGVRATPNIYLSASSLYGLQLVKQEGGEMRRLINGEPGATFMPGQFGPGRGGPGSIYRVDGRTGQITLFATVQFEGRSNSAPGLGNLAYDARTKQIFATDLETGMIHRFTMDGRERDIFDHGTDGRRRAGLAAVPYSQAGRVGINNPAFNAEDTATWGFAPKARMTFALAVQGKRLYYSVAEGPQIWSVSIDDEGDFGKDARLEIDVKDTPASQAVTAIQFDGAGMMYIAQRGEFTGSYDYQLFAKPQMSVVLRYGWDEQQRRWAEAPDEYAIGFPPEHRGTVGGIALNYGYDRNGRINYGACRQTLWTTGEHLREGDNLKRVSTAGGPQIVHGLQGNYKSKVRPANEPPVETWFTDYDSRFEDPEINGHIGNVGIFNPCEGRIEEAVALPIPVVVASEPNLVIEKRCYATGYGGRVRCLITVRNTGGSLPVEDIVIIEDTRVLNGPWAGRPVVIAEFREDRAGWLCTPAGGAEFNCRLAASELAPGTFRVIEVWVDTRDLFINGNYGFRNCVVLRHPNGSGRVCDDGGTDIIVQKTGPVICQPGGLCRYGLTITNNSDDPYAGDLLLSDQMTNGGVPITAPIASISPPLGCAPDPVQVPFTCIANVSLAPGESRTTWIEVQIPPGSEGWVIENCFGATDTWVVSDNTLRSKLFSFVKLGPKVGTGYYSCVRTRIPWPTQPSVPYIPAPPGSSGYIPPDPVCWNGQPPLPGGRCACPVNTRWDPELYACKSPPERGCYDPVRSMPNGQCCPWGSRWDSETWSCRRPPPQGCYDPARRTPTGECCPTGTRYDYETRSCRPPRQTCTNGEPPLPNGLCGCPRGTRWDPVTRQCGKPGDQTGGRCPDGSPKMWGGRCPCPEGSVWNIATQSCYQRPQTCPPGTAFNPRTQRCERIITDNPPRCPLNAPVYNPETKRCERPGGGQKCPDGQVMINGRCQPVQTENCPQGQSRVNGRCTSTGEQPRQCPEGQTRQANGQCSSGPVPCPSGTTLVNGQCVPRRDPSACPNGQPRLPNGNCGIGGVICRPGEVRQPNGICGPAGGNEPKPCSVGMVRRGNTCVPGETLPKPCPQGQIRLEGGACAPNRPPAPSKDCKPGFTKTASGACLPDSVTNRCPSGQIRQNGVCKPLLRDTTKVDPKPKPKPDPKPAPKPKPIPTREKVPVPKRTEQAPKRSLPSKPQIQKVQVPKRVVVPPKRAPGPN